MRDATVGPGGSRAYSLSGLLSATRWGSLFQTAEPSTYSSTPLPSGVAKVERLRDGVVGDGVDTHSRRLQLRLHLLQLLQRFAHLEGQVIQAGRVGRGVGRIFAHLQESEVVVIAQSEERHGRGGVPGRNGNTKNAVVKGLPPPPGCAP